MVANSAPDLPVQAAVLHPKGTYGYAGIEVDAVFVEPKPAYAPGIGAARLLLQPRRHFHGFPAGNAAYRSGRGH